MTSRECHDWLLN